MSIIISKCGSLGCPKLYTERGADRKTGFVVEYPVHNIHTYWKGYHWFKTIKQAIEWIRSKNFN